MEQFENLLLRTVLFFFLLLVLAQALLALPRMERRLSRAVRLEGKAWQPLAQSSSDMLN